MNLHFVLSPLGKQLNMSFKSVKNIFLSFCFFFACIFFCINVYYFPRPAIFLFYCSRLFRFSRCFSWAFHIKFPLSNWSSFAQRAQSLLVQVRKKNHPLQHIPQINASNENGYNGNTMVQLKYFCTGKMVANDGEADAWCPR